MSRITAVKYLLLLLLVSLASAAGGSGNYIYLHKDIIGKEHYSLWIEEDGAVTWIHYQTTILEHRRGKVPTEELDALFQVVRTRVDHALRNREPLPERPNALYEPVSYKLVFSLNGRVRIVSFAEHAMPEAFREIVERLWATARTVPDSQVYGTFIRARSIEKQYYINGKPWKTESELIRQQGIKFHVFSQDRIRNYPGLRESLSKPGKFIHLDGEAVTALQRLSQDGRRFYLSFENQDFEVTFYTRKEEK